MDNNILIQLQETEISILSEIDNYCSENNIVYSLYAGTALGAVRHGGFIPWDDDMDIVMTRDNYERFCKCWKEHPMKGFYLQNIYTDPECGINHAKIRKDNTILLSRGQDINKGHHGIWVDIFIWDKVPDSEKVWKEIKRNSLKLFFFTRASSISTDESFVRHMVKKLIALIPGKIRSKRAQIADREISRYKDVENGYYWISLSSMEDMQCRFPKEISKKCETIDFSGHQFKIYSDYRQMLSILYGDYMQLPPKEQQICRHRPERIEF